MLLDAPLERVLLDAQRIGSIGPGPLADHVAHALAFVQLLADYVGPRARVLDLGSGGGLPGLVVTCALPELSLTLLDGRTERARYLTEALAVLERRDVSVVGMRAELAGRDGALRGSFDAVIARGFGPPATTAECAAPFLAPGGRLIVSEPPEGTAQTPRWPDEGCALLGLQLEASTDRPYAFAVLCQRSACPDRFPRRVGVPRKRPLF